MAAFRGLSALLLCCVMASSAWAGSLERLELKRSILAGELVREKTKLLHAEQAVAAMAQGAADPSYQQATERVRVHKDNVASLESELRSLRAEDKSAKQQLTVRVKPVATAVTVAEPPARRWEVFEREIEEWDVYRRTDP